jgi:lipopolysaccharide transport system ATP-binding protein
VIQVERIGKRYRIGQAKRQTALSHAIGDALRAPARLFRRGADPAPGANGSASTNGNKSIRIDKDSSGGSPYLWALKDVTFDVKEGEVVGLIGRNGAGKSTLLKILARVTCPTEGHAELHGRIGSLLEVGTGFHPELTGRENVFMSGAVLGMRAAEIRRKFDEIVAFSEVERFLDTPLKHYSTGMQMRLAFAVAAHLEPEILFVDEVLAVGDVGFQKKCLGKMGDVAREGRTIILVSHNMAAINALCSRCVILNAGGIEFDGTTDKATARYYAESLNVSNGPDLSDRKREGTGKARFTSIAIEAQDANGHPLSVASPGCDLSIDVDLECELDFAHANLAIIFYDSNGSRIIDTNTAQKGDFVMLKAGQVARASFRLQEVLLKPGKYLIGLWIGREGVENIDHVEHATTIDFAENEETSGHPVLYPGTYLCRFEEHVSILEPSLRESPRA